MKFKNKYIGKPTKEIRINLNDFGNAPIGEIFQELQRQDQQHNTNKSYSIEIK